jgi:hypothetical protein
MNRDRRTVIGNIFANAATYTLTAGIIGSFFAGKFEILVSIWSGVVFTILVIIAYFITPKDKEDK